MSENYASGIVPFPSDTLRVIEEKVLRKINGGNGGNVVSVQSGNGISVDSSDPANPVVSAPTLASKVNKSGDTMTGPLHVPEVVTQSISAADSDAPIVITGGDGGLHLITPGPTEVDGSSVKINGDNEVNVQAPITNFTGDIEATNNAKGVILKSPDGTRYRIRVANGGALSAVAV